MAREDFLKNIDARNYRKEQEFEGVRVVYTEDRLGKKENIEMFDLNGNRFFIRSSSKEEAEKIVEQLKEDGQDAIIGPKAPNIGADGSIMKNLDENAVRVYLVKHQEDKKLETEEFIK